MTAGGSGGARRRLLRSAGAAAALAVSGCALPRAKDIWATEIGCHARAQARGFEIHLEVLRTPTGRIYTSTVLTRVFRPPRRAGRRQGREYRLAIAATHETDGAPRHLSMTLRSIGRLDATIDVEILLDGACVFQQSDRTTTWLTLRFEEILPDLAAALRDGRWIDVSIAAPERREIRIDLDDARAAIAAAEAAARRLLARYRAGGCALQNKLVCTAMNRRYGFGAFRNAVWLAYARRRLTPAHERGYHLIAKPLVAFAYGGEGPARRLTRRVIEHMARERTADIWAEMRGGPRRWRGRLYRAALEPLCAALGRIAIGLCARRS